MYGVTEDFDSLFVLCFCQNRVGKKEKRQVRNCLNFRIKHKTCLLVFWLKLHSSTHSRHKIVTYIRNFIAFKSEGLQ